MILWIENIIAWNQWIGTINNSSVGGLQNIFSIFKQTKLNFLWIFHQNGRNFSEFSKYRFVWEIKWSCPNGKAKNFHKGELEKFEVYTKLMKILYACVLCV